MTSSASTQLGRSEKAVELGWFWFVDAVTSILPDHTLDLGLDLTE